MVSSYYGGLAEGDKVFVLYRLYALIVVTASPVKLIMRYPYSFLYFPDAPSLKDLFIGAKLK